ncbi:mandelate racemase/muconate lactonizing enzyme family protein [Glacieibacterium frigidum]|uniref:Mandelate racemase/muconate lactonizing enzyme family protein n=2 Tax=Glacieibacterium frigidum TaxID=2593303 RepID=A0A552UGK0_9SPHN|nr:mandelate racemase/muconate lactonizing enzyme family protein [Glacieibacterium frigidum]
MRITSITPYLMAAGAPSETAWSAGGISSGGSRHWCFVRIETDAGISGVGEGSGWPRMVAAGIADLATVLIGEDPRNIDRLWHRMFVSQMGHGQTGTPGSGAMAAIDMALWDITAKSLGVPVWQLLGGKFRDRVRCYVHASSTELAVAAVAEGYGALKAGNIRTAVDKVAALREAVGRDIDIAVDLHGPPWLNAPDAIAIARALEPYDLLFLEEALAPEDLAGLRRLRSATDLPLAAGERSALLWGYRQLIGEGLVDIVQPDMGRVGISQMRKIAVLAEANFVSVAPHSGTLGPIAEYAAIHLLAAIPNALIHERFRTDWEGRARVITQPLEIVDGHMVVPDRPGLGVDIVLDEIAKHPPDTNIAAHTEKYLSAYEDGTCGEALYFQPRRHRARLRRDG